MTAFSKLSFLRSSSSMATLLVASTLVLTTSGVAAHASESAFERARVLPVSGLAKSEPTPEEVAKLIDASLVADTGVSDTKQKKDPLAFCHSEKWSEACLTALLVYRCNQYAFPFVAGGCSLASTAMVRFLDLERIDVTYEDQNGRTRVINLPVIFTTKLRRMIEDPKVQQQIRALNIALEESARERKAFHLWNWTLRNTGGRAQAIEFLAVLLQDTSGIQIQVEYLHLLDQEGKLSTGAQRALDQLSDLNAFLHPENLSEMKYKEWLTLYPQTKNIEAEVTPLVYHLYPMAYLALQMKPLFGNRLAAFLPFLFNAEYKNQDIDPEMWPFRHPRSEKVDLRLGKIKWAMRDIYAGLAGGLFAIGHIEKTPGLNVFQEAYARAPFRTMQRLFWTLP